MITTVRQKNVVIIPVDVARRLGIQPGSQLDWQPVEGKNEIVVRVIPRRGERARRAWSTATATWRPCPWSLSSRSHCLSRFSDRTPSLLPTLTSHSHTVTVSR